MKEDEVYMDWKLKIANGIMWFLILIGLGGCIYIGNQTGPVVVIKTSTEEKESGWFGPEHLKPADDQK